MLKNINWFGIFSLLFTMLALFLSSTLFLFIFAMFSALLALLFAHYAPKTLMVKIARGVSAFVLIFWTGVLIFSLFSNEANIPQ